MPGHAADGLDLVRTRLRERPLRWVVTGVSCPIDFASISGETTYWYQSEFGSAHSDCGSVGHPISAWKPAIAVPRRNPSGKRRTPSSPPVSSSAAVVSASFR